MKTKKNEQKIIVSNNYLKNYIKDSIFKLSNNELVSIFKIIHPEINNECCDENNFYYSIFSDELITWEEEVMDMTDAEVLKNIHQLLSKQTINVPDLRELCFSGLPVIDYLRILLKENQNEI